MTTRAMTCSSALPRLHARRAPRAARRSLATPARCALQDYEEEKLPQSKRSAKKPAAAAPKKPVAPDSSDEVRGPLLARAGLGAR